jgi:hypothetical protein
MINRSTDGPEYAYVTTSSVNIFTFLLSLPKKSSFIQNVSDHSLIANKDTQSFSPPTAPTTALRPIQPPLLWVPKAPSWEKEI